VSKVDIAGIGIWAPAFADWPAFCAGLESGRWSTNPDLQPELIPARERRRAPQPVKMAIEVMHQACTMASQTPRDVSVVFSSAMGDMLITDYLCRTLAESPRLVSPTRFHNSVHNAAPGYWSITTGAFTPATAVSAYDFTATMALLEGAIQVVEEDAPVVVVTQEMAAPVPLLDTCPSQQPFSAALLLTPPGQSTEPVCSLNFSVSANACSWPALDPLLCDDFASNFGARLLPLLAALARGPLRSEHRFPISELASLSLLLVPASDAVD
jgi:hypothetical protein